MFLAPCPTSTVSGSQSPGPTSSVSGLLAPGSTSLRSDLYAATSSVSGLRATGPTSTTSSLQAGCATTSSSADVSASTGFGHVSTTPSFQPNIRLMCLCLLNEVGVCVCVWGTQTTTGVQLDASHELFTYSRGNQHPGSQVLGSLPPLRVVSAEEGA